MTEDAYEDIAQDSVLPDLYHSVRSRTKQFGSG
jgi:hypothetical protein